MASKQAKVAQRDASQKLTKKIFRNEDRHWQWIREFEEIERKGD